MRFLIINSPNFKLILLIFYVIQLNLHFLNLIII